MKVLIFMAIVVAMSLFFPLAGKFVDAKIKNDSSIATDTKRIADELLDMRIQRMAQAADKKGVPGFEAASNPRDQVNRDQKIVDDVILRAKFNCDPSYVGTGVCR